MDLRAPDARPPGLTRSTRHRLAAGVVAAYLLAAVAVIADRADLPMPTWLALHLLLLGGASTAILVYSRHFALALLHARPGGERAADARVLVLNVGALLVLVGVCTWTEAAVAAGAGLVVLVVAAHVASLLRLYRASHFAGRLGVTVWYYVGAGLALLLGGVLGALLGTGAVSGTAYQALHVAHAQVNLLGWVGLTVVGTLFMLWPAVLRTRMDDAAPRRAGQVLAVTGAGLALAVAALLGRAPLAAAAGVALYTAGVALSLEPFVRTAVRRPPHSGASWLLASATGWFVVALCVDVAALAGGRPLGDGTLDGVVPLLAVGVVAPVLVGALAFLLPVTVGGGPIGNRRLTAQLDTGWPVRTAAGNLGVLLVALPTSGWLLTTGWALALAGWGSGALLTAVGAATHRRRPPA